MEFRQLTGSPAAVLAVTACGTFMAMLDNLAVNNALPRIASDLGGGISALQWVVEAYTLALAALLLSSSALGRRFGHRRAFLLGTALFAAGALGAALAPALPVLILGRAVQGVGGAFLLPAGGALLRAVYPDDRARAKASGVRGAVAGLGTALGPVVGGPLVDAFGWRSVLWVNVPVGLVVLGYGARVLPRTAPTATRMDPGGQLLATVGLGGLTFALLEGPVDGWAAIPVLCGFAAAALALPGFIALERRVHEPMLDLALFRDPAFVGAAAACVTVSAGILGSIFLLSLYFQQVLRWSATGAGLVFLGASAFIVLCAPISACVAARRGPRLAMMIGLALSPIYLAGLSSLSPRSTFIQYVWFIPVLGASIGMTFVPVSITVARCVPRDRAGTASALVDTLRELGAVLGVATFGAIAASRSLTVLRSGAGLLGLTPAQTTSLVHAVVTGALAHPKPGTTHIPGSVREWVDQSFVSGMQLSLRCAAIASGCALFLLLLEKPQAVSRTAATRSASSRAPAS